MIITDAFLSCLVLDDCPGIVSYCVLVNSVFMELFHDEFKNKQYQPSQAVHFSFVSNIMLFKKCS